MENEPVKAIALKKFSWIIRDFSKNKTKKLSSQSFEAGGCKWRILVKPIGKGVDHFCLSLKVADSLPSYGWTRYVYFKLSLINQIDSKRSIAKETQQRFNAGHSSWGASFLHLKDFYDTTKGYLVNHACIVEAQVFVSDVAFKIHNQTHEGQEKTEESIQLEDQSVCSSEGTPSFKSNDGSIWNQNADNIAGTSDVTPSSKYVPSAPPLYPSLDDEPLTLSTLTELIDFKSLTPEELAFMVLVEDICSWYPSLIESQKKRTTKFIHWAFIALGQVLYFLETTKVKNMDESSCEHLKNLWQEVQLFGFDLNWLEPHVEYALGMKDYLEKVEKVKKLKEEVVALETEMKKLRLNLAEKEVDLNIERRHLIEEEKGFEGIDMDAQLSNGIF